MSLPLETVALRYAAPQDVPRMLEIYGWYVENTAAVFEDDVPSEAEFLRRMEQIAKRYAIVVAEENGEIHGFGYVQPLSLGLCSDWSCEICVFVAQDQRRRGIGTMLSNQLIEAEKLSGMQNFYARIPLPAGVDDAHLTIAAKRLSEREGFNAVGRFTKCVCKFGKWYDMLWVEKLVGSHRGVCALIPGSGRFVGSGDEEEAIVQGGAEKVRAVLLGDDSAAIRRLMVCLDGHFDPYYKELLPDEPEICRAVEELLVRTREPDIAEDALDLLRASTAARDFPYLRENLDKVMRFVRADAKALLEE